MSQLLMTTTPTLEGFRIQRYLGVVSAEAIMGANIVRDFMARITDIVGGRSGTYEEQLREAKQMALTELSNEALARGANAVIGIDLDYETVGEHGAMLMVIASGTAVVVSPDPAAQ